MPVPQRWKKKRLVNRPMSRSKARATKALRTPIPMAMRERKITRRLVVKSPNGRRLTEYVRELTTVVSAYSAAG